MAGIGEFLGLLGKVGDRLFQGKKEALRNEKAELERRLSEIQKRNPYTDRDASEYSRIASRLSKINETIANI